MRIPRPLTFNEALRLRQYHAYTEAWKRNDRARLADAYIALHQRQAMKQGIDIALLRTIITTQPIHPRHLSWRTRDTQAMHAQLRKAITVQDRQVRNAMRKRQTPRTRIPVGVLTIE